MQNDKDGSFAILKSISSEICECLKNIDTNCNNLPHIYEFGDDYIIEETLEGTKLIDIIENESISFLEFQKLILDICNAVTELHKHNLCHMDISPENIIKFGKNYILIG